MRHEPVPFDAPAVERGVGFFETILLVGKRAVLWEPHLQRLLGTLDRLRLPAPSRQELEGAASDAAAELPDHGSEELGLRVAWIAVGADLEKGSSWRLDAVVRPIPDLTLGRRPGSRAVTLPRGSCRDTPDVKSTSYFAAVMGLREARQKGADEGLFLAADGTYAEGTSTGLVAWQGGERFVSPHAALPSVTAAAFLSERYTVRPLSESTLRAGALLLGSLTKASPIVSLDGAPCVVPEGMSEEIREFNERLVSSREGSRVL